jgi:hypothetical protein
MDLLHASLQFIKSIISSCCGDCSDVLRSTSPTASDDASAHASSPTALSMSCSSKFHHYGQWILSLSTPSSLLTPILQADACCSFIEGNKLDVDRHHAFAPVQPPSITSPSDTLSHTNLLKRAAAIDSLWSLQTGLRLLGWA